jgi:hypothetical protein
MPPCLPHLPQQRGWLAIPEICLPGEGMFWLGGAAFADVARLGECQPGLPRSGRPAARENVGWGWSMLVSVGWRSCIRFVPGHAR